MQSVSFSTFIGHTGNARVGLRTNAVLPAKCLFSLIKQITVTLVTLIISFRVVVYISLYTAHRLCAQPYRAPVRTVTSATFGANALKPNGKHRPTGRGRVLPLGTASVTAPTKSLKSKEADPADPSGGLNGGLKP